MSVIHRVQDRLPGWGALLFFIFFVSQSAGAAELFSARNRDANWIFYASNQEIADKALIRADRVRGYFYSSLGFESPKSNVPIVFGLGDDQNKKTVRDGEVQVFERDLAYKIQVQWEHLPLSSDEYDFSVIRALTFRMALEKIPRSQRGKIKVVIPNWIPEGMATLFVEHDSALRYQGWATLFARFEKDLTLDELVYRLEDEKGSKWVKLVMAGALCRELIKIQKTRERLLGAICRNPDMSTREWLLGVLEVQEAELDSWWKEAWESEGSLFSPVRLGYLSSQWCVSEYEKKMQEQREDFKNTPSFFTFETILNPWFGFWVQCQKGDLNMEQRWKNSMDYRRDMDLRRNLSLAWFADFQDPYSKRELIQWGKRSISSGLAPAPGEVTRWFDTFEN